MKVLHTVSSLGARSGGPSQSIYATVSGLNQLGIRADILTMDVKDPAKDHLTGMDIFIKAKPRDAISPLAISRNMRSYLRERQEYDIYQTHGLWMDINHATCAFARQQNKPYIITPRGMLYPEALARSSWKKKLLLALGHKKDIALANCIHATCKQEMEHYRALGFTNPVAVIPNPVAIPDFTDSIHRPNDCFRIGFLGRIHPRKHVHDLIEAWTRMGTAVKNGELLIIGQGDARYMQQLHNQVVQAGLSNVRFAGFLSGKEKFEALASLTALFVPSDFENFGMIIPEALIVKTPVMASLGTPWEELNSHHCGWWRNNSVESLCECLEMAHAMSSDELNQMGVRGRELICSSYSCEKVAQMMSALYGWLLSKNEKPGFIYV